MLTDACKKERVAVVTGATQGLGLALAASLAARMEPNDVVYLTGRRADRVADAAGALRGVGMHVMQEVLDVTEEASVARFVDVVRARHGGIDIAFSNAAARITPHEPPRAQVRQFVATNNFGTTRILRAFMPLLREGSRLFVVASSFGTLRSLPPELHHYFDDPGLTLDVLDEVMASFVGDVELDRAGATWPTWINIPSKVGQVAAVRVVAQESRAAGRNVLVSAVCPGLVDTAASRPWFGDMSGAQRPEAAAEPLVALALGQERPDIHGQLVQFGRVLPWR